jgi:hypothetical protein
MLSRFIIATVLWASIGAAFACDCVQVPVKNAKRGADIVFRGTVVAMRGSETHEPVATFKVVRVWKGEVTELFEMPAIQEVYSCLGFLPTVEVGADILVYARRLVPSDPDYFPLTCQTELSARAMDQIQQLGLGRKPKKSK